jgi:hypothetical protein
MMTQQKVDRVDAYGISLAYHHAGKPVELKDGSHFFHTSSYMSSRDTLDEAREALIEMVQYYEAIDCQITKAIVTRFCTTCDATGKVVGSVARNRVRKYKRCPACRGKDSEVVTEIWANLPKALWR